MSILYKEENKFLRIYHVQENIHHVDLYNQGICILSFKGVRVSSYINCFSPVETYVDKYTGEYENLPLLTIIPGHCRTVLMKYFSGIRFFDSNHLTENDKKFLFIIIRSKLPLEIIFMILSNLREYDIVESLKKTKKEPYCFLM
jgi:hypothetical protein